MSKIIFWLVVVFAIGGTLYWIVEVNICDDGTIRDTCSSEKPLFCDRGELVENTSECGCAYGYEAISNSCEKKPTCTGGIFYGECSLDKPSYCSSGVLVNMSSECGCPEDQVRSGESCISKYEVNPKTVILPEVGEFLVYGGLNEYLDNIPDTISYYEDGEEPTTEDFILKDIDNEIQREYMKPLVEMIRNMSSDKEEQGRIAIKMIQGIPFDEVGGSEDGVPEGRLPYEVLYDMSGVCGSKSQLLVYLLRELDIGSVILEFEEDNHRAVGVKCNSCSYQNSGYCFVETNTPTIVTDSEGEYGEEGKLGEPSEIIVISDGSSLDFSKECEDAADFDRLRNKGTYLKKRDYNRWEELVEGYRIEVAEE